MLCPSWEECVFFDEQMSDMPGMAKLIQDQFCSSDYSRCARFMAASVLGMERVPPTLFPGQAEKARAVLEAQEE